jgi:hypothetical protein
MSDTNRSAITEDDGDVGAALTGDGDLMVTVMAAAAAEAGMRKAN